MLDNVPAKHLLILGGTTEARELARRVTLMIGKKVRVTTSLAGRRNAAPNLAGEVRTGGFGGMEGLRDYLGKAAVDLVVDATHPFSPTISDHANTACSGQGVPRLQLSRPAWTLPSSAKYLEAGDMAAAAEMLPRISRRVFLTIGLRGLEAFSGFDDLWFLVRLIDTPETPPILANHHLIFGNPPYSLDAERALLAEHNIDTLVSKQSGGLSTEAKITAAIEAGVTIVLIRRPPPEPGPRAETVDEAFAWIESRI